MRRTKHRYVGVVDNKLFIEVYLRSKYSWEVADELGLPEGYVSQHASYLRTRGVNLPRRYARVEVDELNQAIAEIEKQMKASSEEGS